MLLKYCWKRFALEGMTFLSDKKMVRRNGSRGLRQVNKPDAPVIQPAMSLFVRQKAIHPL